MPLQYKLITAAAAAAATTDILNSKEALSSGASHMAKVKLPDSMPTH